MQLSQEAADVLGGFVIGFFGEDDLIMTTPAPLALAAKRWVAADDDEGKAVQVSAGVRALLGHIDDEKESEPASPPSPPPAAPARRAQSVPLLTQARAHPGLVLDLGDLFE